MFRKTKLVVLIIAVSLVLTAAGLGNLPSVRAADTIKIGLLTDQSGGLKIYGIEQENGFTLGLQYATGGKMEVAGMKLEVVKRDNAGKNDVAASQTRELIEKEGIDLFFGAPSSGVTLQIQQIVKDADVMLMAGPAAVADITGKNFNVNTFRVCRNVAQDFLTFGNYAPKVGKKYVTLAADYEFGRASAVSAETIFKPLGIQFVAPTIFAPLTTTDFTPYLQQVLASGADAVLLIWAGDSSARLFQQIDELGVSKKIAVVGGFNSNPVMKAGLSGGVNNLGWIVYHYTLPKTKINDWLVENHKKAYNNTPPDLFTECSFATAQALVAALEKTKGDTSSKAMIAALEGMSFDGPKGKYTIRKEDHQALAPMYVVKINNLTDPNFKYYDLLEEVSGDKNAPPCDVADRCPKAAAPTPAATK